MSKGIMQHHWKRNIHYLFEFIYYSLSADICWNMPIRRKILFIQSINQSYLLSNSTFNIFNMIRFVINTSFVNRWFLHIFNQNLNIETKPNFDRAYKDVYLSLKHWNVWIFLRKQYKDTWLKTQNNIQCTYIYSKSV